MEPIRRIRIRVRNEASLRALRCSRLISLLLLLLLLVVGSFAAGAPSQGIATTTSWPMFRGNPGLTGLSPAKLPATPKLVWTYKTTAPIKSSAAIVDGKVYVGSDDKQ